MVLLRIYLPFSECQLSCFEKNLHLLIDYIKYILPKINKVIPNAAIFYFFDICQISVPVDNLVQGLWKPRGKTLENKPSQQPDYSFVLCKGWILRNFAALKCKIALLFNVIQPQFKWCSRNSTAIQVMQLQFNEIHLQCKQFCTVIPACIKPLN
jgi:hypothetical protein